MTENSGSPAFKAVSPAELDSLLNQLLERFMLEGGEQKDLQALHTFGESVSRVEAGGQYSRWPAEAHEISGNMLGRGGQKLLAAFYRVVILERIKASRERLAAPPLCGTCTPFFEEAVSAICSEIASTDDADLDLTNDAFAKDLSVVALRLWPLGVVLAEPRSGIPRRLLFQGGVSTLLRGGALYLRHGGFAPFYETHAYMRNRHAFNEEGWRTFYRLLGGIMARDPASKGVFGNTWFWDPQVESVSPHLAYLRRVPLEGGAVCMKVRTSQYIVDLALATSRTRRALYEQGKYTPQNYLMFWPRTKLVQWAERQTAGR